jgi:hypothetical protein
LRTGPCLARVVIVFCCQCASARLPTRPRARNRSAIYAGRDLPIFDQAAAIEKAQ